MFRIGNNAAAHGTDSPSIDARAPSVSPTRSEGRASASPSRSRQRSAISSLLCGLIPFGKRAASPKDQHPVSSAAQHLGQLDAKGRFVATGKWNGPDDASAQAMPSRTRPLQPHEVQQAGYQLGARLSGNAIEEADVRKNLAEATETIHQTRLDHKYGRGNISSDVRASNGESAARAAAACKFIDRGMDVTAGVSLALGATVCDLSAAVNARRHAAKMEPGGMVHVMKDMTHKHSYAIYNPAPRPPTGVAQEGHPTIVLDSWANGPAVRLQDSAWTSALGNTFAGEALDKASGTAAHAAMERASADATYKGFFGNRTTLYAQSRAEVEKYRATPPRFQQFSSNSVVDPALAEQARRNLDAPKPLSKDAIAAGATREGLDAKRPLHKDILAAGAARQSYNLGVAQATNRKTLDEVLKETRNLTSQGRPPIASR